MNDSERQEWIENDEGLYSLYISYRRKCYRGEKSIKSFIRHNRVFITEVIDNVLNGRKKPHYLIYG